MQPSQALDVFRDTKAKNSILKVTGPGTTEDVLNWGKTKYEKEGTKQK